MCELSKVLHEDKGYQILVADRWNYSVRKVTVNKNGDEVYSEVSYFHNCWEAISCFAKRTVEFPELGVLLDKIDEYVKRLEITVGDVERVVCGVDKLQEALSVNDKLTAKVKRLEAQVEELKALGGSDESL